MVSTVINRTSLVFSFLVELSHITRLVLAHNKLASLPDSISELRSLEYLSLFGNILEDLPQSMNELSKLKELNLANNRLCDLPRGFGSFSSLEVLDLTYNNLNDASFPGNWKFLGATLRALYMGDNDLTKFPPDIKEFTHLTVLVLRDNQIREVPPELAYCSDMQQLHLQVNQINVLPVEFARLPVLSKGFSLKLYGNPLKKEIEEVLRTGPKQMLDFIKKDKYKELLMEFRSKTNAHTIVKRDKTHKQSRKTKKHKVTPVEGCEK